MIGKNLKVINLFLIFFKLIRSIFYSVRSVINFSMNQYLSKIDSLLGNYKHMHHLKSLTKRTKISDQGTDCTSFSKFC